VGTLLVVVVFSTTTIVGTFLSRRLWNINFMLGLSLYLSDGYPSGKWFMMDWEKEEAACGI
jgi:hypothetical protein